MRVLDKHRDAAGLCFLVAMCAMLSLLALYGLTGCSGAATQSQARAAEVVGVTSETVFAVLAAEYKQAGLDAVAAAETEAEADAELDRIREDWRPVWAAWDLYADAYDVWRAAIAARDIKTSLEAAEHARKAYCGLRRHRPTLPAFPGGCS